MAGTNPRNFGEDPEFVDFEVCTPPSAVTSLSSDPLMYKVSYRIDSSRHCSGFKTTFSGPRQGRRQDFRARRIRASGPFQPIWGGGCAPPQKIVGLLLLKWCILARSERFY